MLKTALDHRELVHAETKHQNLLRFSLDRDWYGVNAGHVAEVIRCPRIFNIPHSPDHVVGVVNMRGEILIIINIRRLLEPTAAESNHCKYVVVVERQDIKVGILADRVSDLVNVPELAARSSPSGLDDTAGFIAGKARAGGEALTILDLDKLLELPEA